jgi:predicted kinase
MLTTLQDSQLRVLSELDRPFAVMSVGMPGSGKSEYCRYLGQLLVGSSVIDIGAIRSDLDYSLPNAERNRMAWDKTHQSIARQMAIGNLAIVVLTNATKEQRRLNTEKIRSLGALSVVGLYIRMNSIQTAFARKPNAPRRLISSMYNQLKDHPPTLQDGFDALIEIQS